MRNSGQMGSLALNLKGFENASHCAFAALLKLKNIIGLILVGDFFQTCSLGIQYGKVVVRFDRPCLLCADLPWW